MPSRPVPIRTLEGPQGCLISRRCSSRSFESDPRTRSTRIMKSIWRRFRLARCSPHTGCDAFRHALSILRAFKCASRSRLRYRRACRGRRDRAPAPAQAEPRAGPASASAERRSGGWPGCVIRSGPGGGCRKGPLARLRVAGGAAARGSDGMGLWRAGPGLLVPGEAAEFAQVAVTGWPLSDRYLDPVGGGVTAVLPSGGQARQVNLMAAGLVSR
jgi:hypothetical protein